VADVERGLVTPAAHRSWCKWKGEARSWDLDLAGEQRLHVGWFYPTPFPEFNRLRNHFSFYAGRVDCFVDSVRALPNKSLQLPPHRSVQSIRDSIPALVLLCGVPLVAAV
jgi:hypothetical protein